VAAGVELYRAMPDRFLPPQGTEPADAEEAIEDPEAPLDLTGVQWEMPTADEFEETQRLLAAMAANQTTTVRAGAPVPGTAAADDDREWV